MNAKPFERAIDYVTSHGDVWLTTAGEIAEWYYANYYDKAAFQPATAG